MFDRRLVTHFNWGLMILTLMVAALGLINLNSATATFDLKDQASLFHAQLLWTAIGASFLLVIVLIHYRHYRAMSYVIYAFGNLLLLLVLFVGRKIYGHQSWLAIGSFSLQPTELAKITMIIGLSRLLADGQQRVSMDFKDLLPGLALILFPTFLVAKQGDLGSSFFFILIGGSLLLLRGIRWYVLVATILLGMGVCTMGYFFFLSPYQKDGIATFMNPELDRKGAGYQIVQAKIAVGAGGLWGTGYMKGQTNKLKFVPERHTDFIFTVLAEECGFAGSFFLMILFLGFLLMGIYVGMKSHDLFSFYLCNGVIALFFWHMVVNLGGALGLIPLTGVPLPFLSYGGSSLLTNWIGIALILNVSMRRFMF